MYTEQSKQASMEHKTTTTMLSSSKNKIFQLRFLAATSKRKERRVEKKLFSGCSTFLPPFLVCLHVRRGGKFQWPSSQHIHQTFVEKKSPPKFAPKFRASGGVKCDRFLLGKVD